MKNEDKIISDYFSGMSIKNISSKYSISDTTIRSFLTQKNIFKNSRKFNLNEHYFDVIDTEEKAYFLGLLYADGYNYEPKSVVRLKLKHQDLEILEKFNKCINSNRKIRPQKDYVKDKIHHSWILSLTSEHLSRTLKKQGCHRAKSLTLEFPKREQVPDHLIRHFIRGYFDGDGCVYHNKARGCSLQVTILSTEIFLSVLQKIIYEEMSAKTSLYQLNKGTTNHITKRLKINGKKANQFLNWLYKDSTVYLKRKHQRYLDWSGSTP